ncbi:hypothetical protein ACJJTC_001446 [Scirpophaga incertulas]
MFSTSAEVWSKCFNDIPSGFDNYNCPECGKFTRNVPTIWIKQQKQICDEGYGALGKYLQQTTTNFQTTCYQCERTVCNVNRVYNHHVYVELKLRKNLKSQLMTCKLSEFEKSIEFSANNNTFRLKGIIGYSPGHFVAFCRRSNNQWELHNDLSTKEVRITHDPTITPTAAIFIRRDTAVRNQPIKRKRTEE